LLLICTPPSFVLVVDALVVVVVVVVVDALVVVVVVVVVVVGLKGDLRDSTPNCLLTCIPPYRCLPHLSFVGSPASVFPVNVPPGSPKPKPESVGLTSENNWSNNLNLHALAFPDQRS
jgi:hypothetical protein